MFFGKSSSFHAKDVAIVTGGNAGIGYETALQLTLHHAKVYLAARSEQKATTAIAKIKSIDSTPQIEFLHLDLESLESVRTAAETFLQKENTLDILICNAGVITKEVELTPGGIEKDFQVNHLGHFYLSRLLLGAMTPSSDARLVLVASDAHSDYPSKDTKFESLEDINENKSFLKRYGQSKLAMILYAQELASQLQHTPILVNSLHPGDVDTGTSPAFHSTETEMVRNVFSWFSGLATWWYDRVKPFTRLTPYEGSLTTLYVATSPEIKKQDLRGRYFVPIAKLGEAKGLAKDSKRQKDVWDLSERLLRERGFEIPKLG